MTGHIDEKSDDAPVYDPRGNVRPRGTPGARPMTYEERVEIAKRLGYDREAERRAAYEGPAQVDPVEKRPARPRKAPGR